MRQLLKRTFLYNLFQQFHFWKWTEDDERRLKFYQQFVKPGDLVFDVGANVGNRTKVFLKLQAKVVAFEPQKICADFLEQILKKNPNFTLVKKALGGKEGEGKMLLGEISGLSTLSEEWLQMATESNRFGEHKWKETQSVQITTLDKAIFEFGVPSFIKIDVENFELEVLLGLSQSVACISIEFHAETIQNTIKCIDYVEKLSPKALFQISKEAMIFELQSWVSAEEIKQILFDLVNQEKFAWGDIYIFNSSISCHTLP
ncbi:methyltransferase FkbM family protein [Cylindrospermum sp. NIES-4074]|nr:methyltransferase FkbM family protein [Cylindrospermum sp. NIES-4074]